MQVVRVHPGVANLIHTIRVVVRGAIVNLLGVFHLHVSQHWRNILKTELCLVSRIVDSHLYSAVSILLALGEG